MVVAISICKNDEHKKLQPSERFDVFLVTYINRTLKYSKTCQNIELYYFNFTFADYLHAKILYYLICRTTIVLLYTLDILYNIKKKNSFFFSFLHF